MKYACLPAALLLTLSACSSVGSLRNTGPNATYTGSESISSVVSCVNDAWSRGKLMVGTTMMVGGTSIQLQQTEDGPVLAMADIKAVGDQTMALYYSNLPDGDSWYSRQVKQCML